MTTPVTAPFGTWTSPVTARSLVDAGVGLRAPWRRDGTVHWLESRANEGGRTVPVRRTADGAATDLLPAPWDVRGRVHEYGGGDVLHLDDGLVFCHGPDQAVYLAAPGAEPVADPVALPVPGRDRFADFAYDAARRRLIAVRERHAGPGHAEPENALVAIPLDGGPSDGGPSDGGTVLVRGADFYASPRLSPDGRRLAWLNWSHPDMPWDGTELWVADLGTDGMPGAPLRVAGGADEAVVQPVWLADGRLAYVSDRGGWWNLHVWDGTSSRAVLSMEAEFARPLWVFGHREVAAVDGRTLVCAFTRDGLWSLGVVDVDAGTLDRLDLPFTDVAELFVDGRTVVFLAAGPASPNAVISLDLDTRRWDVVKRSTAAELDPGCVSAAQPIRFPTETGEAHAFYYPPANAAFRAPDGERPPLIVKSHGGPTAAASAAWNPKIQYWTSRGFAVVDVNYRGSTGYGRPYRDALKGAWGVADVADCVAAAQYLGSRGLADPDRLIVTGSSAGGYTVLCAVTFHDAFRAGASYYGISDLEALATDTHKFEARYLDSLVGPYPERKDLYVARSPIHFVDRLSVPMVFFQGLEDKVVPPAQAERMVEAIDAKGLPVAYVPFEGERHGFRKAESIVAALEGELYFYGRVFGFTPAGEPQAIPIRNL